MPADKAYPNPFEVIRYVLLSLDLKQSNKHLDDLASKSIYDPRALKQELDQGVSSTLEKYMGSAIAMKVSTALSEFTDHYLHNIVGKTAVDGLSRSDVLGLLVKTSIQSHLIRFLTELHQDHGAPHPSLWFSSGRHAIDSAFSWLEEHEPDWSASLASLTKENKDRIVSWRRGKELPSAQSIQLLFPIKTRSESTEMTGRSELSKSLLFIARSIDFIRKHDLGGILIDEARISIWSAVDQIRLENEVKKIQDLILSSIGNNRLLIGKLQACLNPHTEKSDSEDHKAVIRQVRNFIKSSGNLQSTEYWIDWCDARWHVFSGKIIDANRLYKTAFEKAVFVAGDNLKYIIREALVVAANQPSTDKVFLKQLKWSLINFGYDIASASELNPSNKVSHTVEAWEIDLWKDTFYQVFPQKGLYPGTIYSPDSDAIGPLLLASKDSVKPDYRYPNRRVRIGDTWKRSMPQIVWFARDENIDVCRKLIEKGADINVQSEVGDTPILMALEALNLTEVPYRSLNDELYHLISKEKHDERTINARTQKRRLLPIISAVQTGRFSIVEKILSMGANPNGRGRTDEQTPLNVCLKLIGILKDPRRSKNDQLSMPITPEALDSIRRVAHGASGFTLDDQLKSLEQMGRSPEFQEFKSLTIDLMYQRISENMALDEMRRVASLLITAGADVNAEHSSPIKGYTPLMLAAEIDEVDIFEIMLVHGGDTAKTYIDPKSGRAVSILDIARYFDSRSILHLMDRIAPILNGSDRL